MLKEYMEWTKTTAIYPTVVDDPQLVECLYLGLGLANEAGEVDGVIKKWFRDGDLVKENLAKELGDVLWYWARLCDAAGIDPESVLTSNRAKLDSRKERGVLGGSGDNR